MTPNNLMGAVAELLGIKLEEVFKIEEFEQDFTYKLTYKEVEYRYFENHPWEVSDGAILQGLLKGVYKIVKT